jgi:hypothetical protein
MKSSARTRSFARRAAWYMSARSASIWRGAFGRWTFTTTLRTVRQHGTVHLAIGRRGERTVELEEGARSAGRGPPG